MKCTLLLTLLLAISLLSPAQDQWLGERVSNTSIFLDPHEVQVFGSITFLPAEEASYQFLPFAFGCGQSIFSRKLEDAAWEVYGELAAQTQFEWRSVGGEQQRNLFNTDYRIAVSYAYAKDDYTIRIRGFHVSSHLGDDYLIRNEITEYSPNAVNYEQIDVTYYKEMKEGLRTYLGVGGVIRPNSIRLPFSFWAGGQYDVLKADKKWGYGAALNFKSFQETRFQPNIKIGIGPAYHYGKPEPLRLIIEYYNGHLPYSQFEQRRLEWIGAGLYFYI